MRDSAGIEESGGVSRVGGGGTPLCRFIQSINQVTCFLVLLANRPTSRPRLEMSLKAIDDVRNDPPPYGGNSSENRSTARTRQLSRL